MVSYGILQSAGRAVKLMSGETSGPRGFQRRKVNVMDAPAALFERLTPEEVTELRMFAPNEVLTRQALKTIDRAAGGPGFGHHYYATTGNTDENGDPEFVLRPAVAAYLESLPQE